MNQSSPPPLPPPLSPQGPRDHYSITPQAAALVVCRSCRGQIHPHAERCCHCGQSVVAAPQSDALAGCLGIFLGPVGLWYKGHWAAGFAWLAIIIIVMFGTAGIGIVLAPFFWIGMGVHAYNVKPRR